MLVFIRKNNNPQLPRNGLGNMGPHNICLNIDNKKTNESKVWSWSPDFCFMVSIEVAKLRAGTATNIEKCSTRSCLM